MLRSMHELEAYAIGATDGPIGHVKDLYFDDEGWAIRYVVVDTGTWLSSRKVLISPSAMGQPNWADRILPVSITRQQVKNSPDIDTDKPVSRQHEMRYPGIYGDPSYWGRPGLWAGGACPGVMLAGVGDGGSSAEYRIAQEDHARAEVEARPRESGDHHLRSCKAVMKYHLKATDGGIGRLQGLLLDEESWVIQYLIVETGNTWLGHQVLVAPQCIQNVSWPDHMVSVSLTRQAVKKAPRYKSAVTLNRSEEIGLDMH